MSQWEPPADASSGPSVDADADEAMLQRGLAFARPVALGLFACALVHVGTLLQIVLFSYRQYPSIVIGEVGAGLCAVLFVVVGARVYDGSPPFTIAGAVLGFGAALFSFAWFVFLIVWSGAITLLAPFAALTSAIGGVACVILLPSVVRASAARRRLFDA